ncbi:MAG TPA: RluA family pseudouridine synthase [Acidisoma sp.]|uniref:RluA family pseudouridine synthase n=1 Tax=Acidisoma sp. TaxID=1872115 RepID=UPI002BB24288|nr:RluA family pseudouridine synthase [Acidisoma sp.]HTI02890.1 RluA family pseudouridine synthase [Acidisoma sp.]
MADPASPLLIDLTATSDDGGVRLDKFLAERIGTISRSRVKSLILEGRLSRDGAVTTDVSATVQPGAAYRLRLPPPDPATPQGEEIPLAILYEDDALLVLDKPAGLVVHPAPGNPDGTLVNALIAHCGDSLTGIGGERRPGIVHRLDKDTSGVMVVAKTELAHTRLSAAFASRDLDREYKAICWGVPNPARGAIEGDIGRDPRDRKRMAVVTRNGKPALTNYRIVRNYGTAASLVALRLGTGRTHQIRVHMAYIGHPLLGDSVYLRRRPSVAKTLPPQALGLALDFPRQALHAEMLGFFHPITGVKLSFSAPPPADFRELEAALDTCV